MGEYDDISAAVLQIHQAGLDTAKWPEALGAMASLLGGHCASLEILDRPSLNYTAFHWFGVPAPDAYLEHYAPMNPRLPNGLRQAPGNLTWDYQFIDEATMSRHPFYMEFLAPLDMRYSLGGILAGSSRQMILTGVQISPKQGPPTRSNIDRLAVLMPHIQQAVDVNERLGALTDRQGRLERALDWLSDGVLMLAADGSVLYANAAAEELLRRADGLGLRGRALTFHSAEVATKFGYALAAIKRLDSLDSGADADADFPIARGGEASPLAVSLRSLWAAEAGREGALALMFIHDPLVRGSATTAMLREAFGLTPAEADLAAALCAGVSLDNYSRARQISRNTAYTHLRRVKEKTGCTRLAALIRKLNDVQPTAIKQIF